MHVLILAHHVLRCITSYDILTFVSGAVFQQSTDLNVSTSSGRILLLTTFLSTLALFISYSGNIVALIQSPSQSIRTLDDLIASPLELAVQDVPYTRAYLKENETTMLHLYHTKLEARGEQAWIASEKALLAIDRVRVDLYAFLIDTPTAYKAISRTYTESEKCSLSEIHLLRLPMLSLPVQRNSPYKELFKQRYLTFYCQS